MPNSRLLSWIYQILHCNMTLLIYQQQKDGNIQENGVCHYVPRVTFFEGELNLCWGTGEEQHLVAQTVIVRWVRLDPRAENSVPSSWHTSNSSVEIANFCKKLCTYFNGRSKELRSYIMLFSSNWKDKTVIPS